MENVFKLDTMENYDLDRMTKDLQKILRIEDWDVEVKISNKYEMEEASGSKENCGCCYRNRRMTFSRVSINKEHDEACDWFSTLLHELYHIVVDDFCIHADGLLDYTEGTTQDNARNMLTLYEERMVNNLSKGMAIALGIEFVKKYRRIDNGTETKNA